MRSRAYSLVKGYWALWDVVWFMIQILHDLMHTVTYRDFDNS